MPSSCGLLNCAPFVKKGLKIGTLKACCYGNYILKKAYMHTKFEINIVDLTDILYAMGKSLKSTAR